MIPIEFLRQFHIGEYAIFDFVVAFAGVYLFSLLTRKIFLKLRLDISTRSWMFLVLPISIAAHLIVNEMTPMARNLIDLHGHYLLKIIIIGLLLLGIRGIKIIRKD